MNHLTLPCPPPFREHPRARLGKLLRPFIQSLSDPHQQPAEEEQAHEGNAHHDCEYDPVLLNSVYTLDIGDLRREIAGHKTDG